MNHPYTRHPDKIALDPNLSLAAKGLAMMMATRYSITERVPSLEWLDEHTNKNDDDEISDLITELHDAGYLVVK